MQTKLSDVSRISVFRELLSRRPCRSISIPSLPNYRFFAMRSQRIISRIRRIWIAYGSRSWIRWIDSKKP